MNEPHERLSTADVVVAGRERAAKDGDDREAPQGLLAPQEAGELRAQWDQIQAGFVDEPHACDISPGMLAACAESARTVGCDISLRTADAERLLSPESTVAEVSGIKVPRLAVAPGADPAGLVIAALRTADSGQ